MTITHNFVMNNFQSLFDSQKIYFRESVKNSAARERIQKLKKINSWIFANQQSIRDAIHKDFRKPAAEVDLTDIKPVISEIRHTCRHLKKWMKPKRVRAPLFLLGTRSKIIYEPKGVALILAPWNFPFMLTIGPLVSAIAAGNCVILKPSEVTPNTAELISRMIKDLFDEREIALCLGDHAVAEKLLELPFDHIFFTGSPEVGKKVMEAAAKNLSSLTLELGGQNPAIVDETADVQDTAEKLIWGKFMNDGQSCMAPNFIFVHSSIHEALTKSLLTTFEKFYSSDAAGMSKNPDLAHIVNGKHVQRLQNLVNGTMQAGAELLTGGRSNEADCFFAPTILNNVSKDAPVLSSEIFGPVLPILAYDQVEEVIAVIHRNEKPLALYIFTQPKEFPEKIIRATSSGNVCINETTVSFGHAGLPFGGVNHSGIGRAHGHAGFLSFSNERTVLKQRIGRTTLKWVYPPYTKRVRFLSRLVTKYL